MKKSGFGIGALVMKMAPKFFVILQKLWDVMLPLLKSSAAVKSGLIVASAGVYTFLFSWPTAIALVAFIGVHEYGHVYAMKRCGMRTKGMYFIPGMGAAAISEDGFASARNEAYVALMGPLYGLAFFVIPVLLYAHIMNDAHAAAIASLMTVVNLINLLPVVPLDGGRLMKSIAYSENAARSLAVIVIVSMTTMFVGVAFGLSLLVLMGLMGFIEIASLFGIQRYVKCTIRTWLRAMFAIAAAYFFKVGLRDHAGGENLASAFALLLSGFIVFVIIPYDAWYTARIRNTNFMRYPAHVIGDAIFMFVELLTLGRAPVTPIGDYVPMTGNERAKWTIRFIGLFGLHILTIYAIAVIGGVDFAKFLLD